jgi:hypothetical protein
VLYEEYKRVDMNNREKHQREIDGLKEELDNLQEEVKLTND